MCTLISTLRKWLTTVAAIGLLVSLVIPAAGHAQVLPVTTAGATHASYDVTPNGQARYTVPLWTPPGIRGIEPHLALMYGSDVRSATLGHGWTLGGLSKLTRCGRTYAQHGAPQAVTLTMTDAFCLDGQMLRITAGTYGAADSQYQTEFADFTLVIARDAIGNGPAWFEVKTRDGLILEYGNSGDSRALLPNSSTPYVWALNKIRDRDGNNLKVTYSPMAGTLVPSLIEYTQTPLDASYPYAVVFNYGMRTSSEIETGYVAGLTYSETRLLSSIDMRHGGPSGTLLRKYRLSYSNLAVARRRQLGAIQECAGANGTDCKQDTHFTYTSGGAGVIATGTAAGTLPTGGRVFNADLNGDGRGDVVYEQGTGASNQWFVRFGSATGFAAAVSTGITGTGDVLMNDFLGTGQEDLLAPAGGIWHRYRWNGSSFVATSIGLAIDPAVIRVANAGDYPPPSFASADMDGDGLPDLVWAALYNNSPAIWMRRNTSFGTTVRFSGNMVHAFSLPVAPVQFFGLYGAHSSMISDVPRMDFNGDQREDMVVVTLGTAGFADFTARELVSLGETFAAGPTITNFSLGPAPVNWNDDACTDLAHGTRVHISACNATAGQPVDTQKLGFLYMDWNADGRTDSLSMGSTNMEVIYSEGGSAAAPAATTLPATFGGFFIVDFDGDAQSDLVFRDFNNGAFRFHRHLGANSPPGLMLGAFTDDGSSWQPGWTSIVQGNYAPNDGTLPATPFPLIQFTGPVYVVKHYLAGGSDFNFRADFFYWSARKDLRGHTFAGFGRRRMLDSRTGFYSYEEYKERHPWLGQIARQRLLQGDNVTPVFERTNNWSANFLNVDFPNSRVLTYVNISEHKRYEVGGPSNGALIATHTYSQQLDDWGAEIYSQVTFTENATGAQPGAQLSFGRNYDSIVSDTANWCLGRPGRVRDRGSHNLTGGNYMERTTDYSWDYVKCRPTSEIVEPGSAKWQVTRDYRYDSVGNVDRVTETPASGQGQVPRVTSLGYGNTGQFLRSVTDAKSFVTQLEWDAAKSVQTKITDPNGLSTQWEYDNFGRRTKEIRPDGTRTEFALRNCDDGNGYCDFVDDFGTAFAYESIATLRDANNLLVRTDSQVFDSRDLLLATRSQLLTGETSTQVSFIDSYGRIVSKYVPYTSARMPSGQARTTFTYDALGRLTLIRRPMSDTDPSNNDTRFSHSGLTETQTDALNRITTRVRDVVGRIVRVTDATSQSTEYGYDALGNLIRTRDPLGAERSMTFTPRGLKLSANDPDMGVWNYDYFPFGELKSKLDAKNQTITYTYDELSRVLTETMPEGAGSITHSFTYGTSSTAKNIGQLQSMQTAGAAVTTYREAYVYDGSTGRLSQTKYTEGTTDYLVDYAYNPAGLLSKVTYPVSTAGFRLPIEYEYSRGVLSRVFDSVNQFWVANAVDARGHVTDAIVGEVTAGVTFQTLSSYDAVTGALESRQSTFNSGAVSGTPLMNIGVLYDAVGNVIQRQDNQQGLTENFYYDSLNRIDYSTRGATTTNYSYDVRGNLTEKTGVGTLYSYTANVAGCSYYFHQQIHAVRRITGGSSTLNFCYDANGNMTNRNGTSLTWFASNLPKAITKDANNSSTFEYTPTGRRWRHAYRTGGANYTHTYIGPLVEKVVGPTSTAWKHYIYAGNELVSMYVRKTDGFKKRYFFTKDQLGSVGAITREDGTFVVRESFEAFGARRAPNWTGSPSAAELAQMNDTSRKGFTGHEHLDSTGFIHMNGRVYDPLIGRFASADPHVQAPFDPQSLNRFSYVRNNPLRYVDPSGFFGMSCPDCDIGPPGPIWDIDPPFLPPDVVFCIVTSSCDQPPPSGPPMCGGLRRCPPPRTPQPPPPQVPGPEAPAADEYPLASAATLASENVATLAWFKGNVRGQDVEPALGGEEPRILIASLGPVLIRPIPQTLIAQAVSRAVRPQAEVPSPGPGPVANPTGSPAANPKPTAADFLKQTESLNQNTKPEIPVRPEPLPPLPGMGDPPASDPTTKLGAWIRLFFEAWKVWGAGGLGTGPTTTGPVFESPEAAPPFDWDACVKANMCT